MVSDEITGMALAGARVAAGFDQRTLAAKAGYSPAQVSRYEQGRVHIRPRTLHRLLVEIGITAEEFDGLCRLCERAKRRRNGELLFRDAGEGKVAEPSDPAQRAAELLAQALQAMVQKVTLS
jgi:transcriptional regulator with XRE-family HTH domain